jgi:hypothetical protein
MFAMGNFSTIYSICFNGFIYVFTFKYSLATFVDTELKFIFLFTFKIVE